MAKPRAASGHENSPERAFGRVLKSVREGRDLSQEELAARAGYHRTYIGQLERGEKSPSLRTIFNLSSALQVTPSLLVRRVERMV
jgi:transcriptional regulator with XRE-family HTH domain